MNLLDETVSCLNSILSKKILCTKIQNTDWTQDLFDIDQMMPKKGTHRGNVFYVDKPRVERMKTFSFLRSK